MREIIRRAWWSLAALLARLGLGPPGPQVHEDLVLNTPGGVGGQLDILLGLVGVYRLNKPNGADGNKVLNGHGDEAPGGGHRPAASLPGPQPSGGRGEMLSDRPIIAHFFPKCKENFKEICKNIWQCRGGACLFCSGASQFNWRAYRL